MNKYTHIGEQCLGLDAVWPKDTVLLFISDAWSYINIYDQASDNNHVRLCDCDNKHNSFCNLGYVWAVQMFVVCYKLPL